jgi:hypothetical protein
MNRSARLWSSFCIALLCLCSGCLGVRHSTHVVRENEKPRPVQFESEQAKNLFDAGVNQMKAHKETTNVQVSLSWLGWKSQGDVLSDNAVYNDELLACDTNGDGVIAVNEAFAYRGRVEEKMRLLEAQAQARAKESQELKDRLQAKTDPPGPAQR